MCVCGKGAQKFPIKNVYSLLITDVRKNVISIMNYGI